MPIRLKILRKQNERINKVKELMDMYSIKVPSISYPTYEYQPVGGSSLTSNPSTVTSDPKIQKTKDLFMGSLFLITILK